MIVFESMLASAGWISLLTFSKALYSNAIVFPFPSVFDIMFPAKSYAKPWTVFSGSEAVFLTFTEIMFPVSS